MSNDGILPTSNDVRVPNDDPTIIYTESNMWYNYSAKDQGKTYMVTGRYFAQFTYTFVGSEIWYYSDVNKDHGPFSASIDGVMYGILTSAWPIERPGMVLFHASLSTGKHTLTVTNLSSNYTSLDYLVYRPSSGESEPRASSPSQSPAQNISFTSTHTSFAPLTTASPPPVETATSSTAKTTFYISIALGVTCFLLLFVIASLIFVDYRRRRRTAERAKGVAPELDVDHEDHEDALRPFPILQPTSATVIPEHSLLERKFDILSFSDAVKETSVPSRHAHRSITLE